MSAVIWMPPTKEELRLQDELDELLRQFERDIRKITGVDEQSLADVPKDPHP